MFIVISILVLTASLIGIFVGPYVVGAQHTREVLAHGLPAQARILDLADTGTRINDQVLYAITVEVLPPDGVPYQAVFTRVLTLADADVFRRGNIIPIKYDPGHPDRVAVVRSRP